MGNNIQANADSADAEPILFHSMHAANVEVSHNSRRARRVDGNRGLCFSHRPVIVGERVYMKVISTSHGRRNKGVGLRYGYTAVDPESDSTSNQGRSRCSEILNSEHFYWVKGVGDLYTKRGNVLGFCVCIGGEVMYGCGEEELGVLFAGVRTNIPLWVVVDLCGSATAIEFIDIAIPSKSVTSGMTKAALVKYETRRNSRMTQSTDALSNLVVEADNDVSSRLASQPEIVYSSARQLRRPLSVPHPVRESNSEAIPAETSVRRSRRSTSATPSHEQRALHRSSTVPDNASSLDSTAEPADPFSALPPELRTSLRSSNTPTASSDVSQLHSSFDDSQSHHRRSARTTAAGYDHHRQTSITAEQLQQVTAAPSPATDVRDQRRASTVMETVQVSSTSRRYRAADVKERMPFHAVTKGRNVNVSRDLLSASRCTGDFCNAYVFTQRPLWPGQELVMRIVGITRDYAGGLTVGLTACDPSRLRTQDLPDDAEALLDRPEYWVIRKNICSRPKLNDELAFHRTVAGELKYCKNGRDVATLMHVDCTLPLWAFFDIYGSTQQIEILGIIRRSAVGDQRDRPLSPTTSQSTRGHHSSGDSHHADRVIDVGNRHDHALSDSSRRDADQHPVVVDGHSSDHVSSRNETAGHPTTNVTGHQHPADRQSVARNQTEGHQQVRNETVPASDVTVSQTAAAAERPAPVSADALFLDLLGGVPSALPAPLIPIPEISRSADVSQAPLSDEPLVVITPEQTPCKPSKNSVRSAHGAKVASSSGQKGRPPPGGECAICMESEPDSALYPCGHMCMCYECAQNVQKQRSSLCPICRQPIVDILRIYRT